MRVISIRKDLIPYSFLLDVAGVTFKIVIRAERLVEDLIRVDLYNESGEIVEEGTRAIFGVPLWLNLMFDKNKNHNPDYPRASLKFLSVDGQEYPVNYDNLEDKVFLTLEEF